MTRLLACLLVVAFVGAASALRRVCYYTNWAQYRNGAGKFYPENVDPSLCTHVIYAFAKMQGNHLAAYEWNDESTPWSKGMYERFDTSIKSANPTAKNLLSVGGWNMASTPFTAMVASAAGRQEFCRTSIQFLRKNKFDGLDIDWEYPGSRGSPPQDKNHFVELLQECRDQFDAEAVPAGKDKLMLASAVAAGKDKIDAGYNISEVSRLLDMINIMTYDLHGSWEAHTGHHSALYSRTGETGNDTYLNVNWAAQYWVSKGADRAKINIGVPLYGRSFKLSGTDGMIGAPASGAGSAGLYTREGGFLAYYEICKHLDSGATKYYEAEQKVPYYTQGDQWVGYEDTDSVRIKVDYIKKNNFGGVMVWALDLDDFSGMCGQGKYPLMHAIMDEINNGIITTRDSTSTARHTTPTKRVTTPSTRWTASSTKRTTPTHTNNPGSGSGAGAGHDHNISQIPADQFDCTSRMDGYYASPTSCSSYYICVAGMALMSDCHPGLLYNEVSGYCDFPDHVTCSAQNTKSSTTTQTTPTTTTTSTTTIFTSTPTTSTPSTTTRSTTTMKQTPPPAGGHVDPKDFCKGKSDGYYRDPVDCAQFYQCSFEIAYHESCPGGTYFDITQKGCNWIREVPCP